MSEVDRLIRQADALQDKDQLIQIGGELQRLGAYRSAGRVMARAGLIGKRSPVAEWEGRPLAGRSLLVLRRTGHVGAVIRLAHLAARAAADAGRCAAVVDTRLVPLLSRSFPTIAWLDARPEDWTSFDAVASYETLMQHLCRDGPGGPDLFLPLKADVERARRLRARYAAAGRPVIGISWHSANDRKDLPDLATWARALGSFDATFLSLQYGEVETGIARIAEEGGPAILHDHEIDALDDLDGLAAQISATDAVLTVSNTTAHLAGALGHRTAVVLDTKPHLIWPYDRDRSPWYPQLRLVRPAEGGGALEAAATLVAGWLTGPA